MTDYFNASINIFNEKERKITVIDSLHEIVKCTNVVGCLTETIQEWYLTGFSKKEASKYILFKDGILCENVIDVFEVAFQKNNQLINKSIWNGKPDGVGCSISHYMKFIEKPNKSNIVIDIDQKIKATDDMVKAISLLARDSMKTWIMVDSRCYWLHDKNVFPDRAYVGWMIFIPFSVRPELIPEAARVVPVMDEEGKQKGTIIVSTEEVFDGSKKEHIEKSNDIEIRLLDLGLLPLMTEL